MKIFIKSVIAVCITLCMTNSSYGINYISVAAGPAIWNNAATWSPAGIPTSSDDVTIAAGHTVTISSSGCICRNLNVAGTIVYNNQLLIRGNYTVSGTESGSGSILFNGASTLITMTGTSSSTCGYSFNTNVTIAAGSIIVKSTAGSAAIVLGLNKSMTNLGNCTFGTFTGKSGSTFTNSANSTLSLLRAGFMTGATFNAHASGNTVNLRYNAGALPLTTSGYFHLNLSSSTSGTKTLAANTIVAGNLSMSAGNHLNSNNFNLSVSGNWTNAATFTASSGRTVTFNGTTAQNVSNSLGTTIFKELTIDNSSAGGVTLTSGTYILDEVLTLSNGTFNTGGRPFTMSSTASQTARIAPITGSGAIAGNFTINRFITSRDTTWSDLSSPVQNATFGDWAAELPAVFYGSYPTQYTYNEGADDFTPVTSAGTALTPGQGFEVFLSNDFTYADFAARAINTVGVPNQGDQDLSGLISFNGAGSNLVGNPFASSISWDAVFASSSGIESTFDMYDYTAGNYSTYGSGDEIGATQGFWVYTNTPGATLLIPESAKTTSSNSSIRSSVPAPYFTMKLSSNEENNYYSHTLKVSANGSSSNGWDSNDHPYRKSPNKLAPALYSNIEGKKAVINSFNSSDETFSMPVTVVANINGYYKIEANGFENVSDYTCVKLEDKQLNKIIDLTTGEAYSFEIASAAPSDRFVVHFSKSSACRSFSSFDNTSENEITVLPTTYGNSINFDMTEATPSVISVTNILGQHLIESMQVLATDQTVNISIPQDFTGMYIVKIESSKGVVTKKYVKK
ncbi:MAG: hypothetical protein K0S44_1602 [Bacteroidetes bacterium]|jgi:hypothetical protein|nr:hypothetical protein [Bacteroidota bacterium]